MTIEDSDHPVIVEIRRGSPTPEELAALVTVLAALSVDAVNASLPTSSATNGWAARWRGLRTSPRPGRDAWRLSARH